MSIFQAEIFQNNSVSKKHFSPVFQITNMPRLKNCVVPYCFNKGTKGFFYFPKSPEKRNIWLKNCNLTNVNDRDAICKFHFRPEDLVENSDNIRVKQWCAPTIFEVSIDMNMNENEKCAKYYICSRTSITAMMMNLGMCKNSLWKLIATYL